MSEPQRAPEERRLSEATLEEITGELKARFDVGVILTSRQRSREGGEYHFLPWGDPFAIGGLLRYAHLAVDRDYGSLDAQHDGPDE